MSGDQIIIIIALTIATIFCLFIHNFIFAIFFFIATIITANIFAIYNNYRRIEIEKEIYKEIKNKKEE